MSITTRTVEECVKQAREEHVSDVNRMLAYLVSKTDRKVKMIEQHFEILPALEAIQDIKVSAWDGLARIDIELGERPARGRELKAAFARKLVALRRLFDRLHVSSKVIENADKRLVKVTLEAVKFPGVTIEYTTRVPRRKAGAPEPRCKIVKQVSHTLVCDL